MVDLPFVYHLRIVQLNAAAVAGIGAAVAGQQTSRYGAAMLGTTAARIVLVQIVRKCVPAAANAHHDVRAQDLQVINIENKIRICYIYIYIETLTGPYLRAQR